MYFHLPLLFSLGIALIASVVDAAEESDWSSFRGSKRDGHSTETGLLQTWPEGGPKLLWTSTGLGDSHSSVVAGNGLIYTGGRHAVYAIDCESGEVRWKQGVQGGSPSATPALHAGKLYLQFNGHLYCWDAITGKKIWKKAIMSFVPKTEWKDGTRYGTWHSSPVVEAGKVVVVTGHPQAPVIALDAASGELLWASKGSKGASSRGWSSPIIRRVGSTDLVVAQTAWHLLCLDFADGTVHWEFDLCQPVSRGRQAGNSLANLPVLEGNVLHACTKYAATKSYGIELSADGKSATKTWSCTMLTPYQESVLHVNGLLFGSTPRLHMHIPWDVVDKNPDMMLNGTSFQELKGKFWGRPKDDHRKHKKSAYVQGGKDSPLKKIQHPIVCQDLKTGQIRHLRSHGFPPWSLYGGAMLIYADNRIYCAWAGMKEGGMPVYLMSADADMTLHGQFHVPRPPKPANRKKGWGNIYCAPAIYRKRLLIRFGDTLFAYNISQ